MGIPDDTDTFILFVSEEQHDNQVQIRMIGVHIIFGVMVKLFLMVIFSFHVFYVLSVLSCGDSFSSFD